LGSIEVEFDEDEEEVDDGGIIGFSFSGT